MTQGSWILMIATVLATAACGGSAAPRSSASTRPPPLSASARNVRAIEWSRRVPSAKPWRAPGKRLQLVITRGWAKGEHYAWFVANGTEVVAVIRATSSDEVAQVVTEFTGDMVFETIQSPTASASWGILGSIIKPPPPPPPPDPGGVPPDYIKKVVDVAWLLDRRVQGPALAPGTGQLPGGQTPIQVQPGEQQP